MSEGKGKWFIGWDGTRGGYSLIVHDDLDDVLIKFEHEDREQREHLTAWLNHIAPDGIIPPAPEKETAQSSKPALPDGWQYVDVDNADFECGVCGARLRAFRSSFYYHREWGEARCLDCWPRTPGVTAKESTDA